MARTTSTNPEVTTPAESEPEATATAAAEEFKEVELSRPRDGQTRLARTPADLVKYQYEGFATEEDLKKNEAARKAAEKASKA